MLNKSKQNSKPSVTTFLDKASLENINNKSATHEKRRTSKKYLYEFVHNIVYTLNDKKKTLLSKVNYDQWKRPLLLKTIDIIYNSLIIAIVIMTIQSKNVIFKGIGITLLFILLKSYVKEFHELFKR